jgi:hypothetical protein
MKILQGVRKFDPYVHQAKARRRWHGWILVDPKMHHCSKDACIWSTYRCTDDYVHMSESTAIDCIFGGSKETNQLRRRLDLAQLLFVWFVVC